MNKIMHLLASREKECADFFLVATSLDEHGLGFRPGVGIHIQRSPDRRHHPEAYMTVFVDFHDDCRLAIATKFLRILVPVAVCPRLPPPLYAQMQLLEGCACHPHPLCREIWCKVLKGAKILRVLS